MKRDIVTAVIYRPCTITQRPRYIRRNMTLAFQHTSMEVLALRSVIFIRKISKVSKFRLKCLLTFFPMLNTSIRRVTFRVMKLGRYVIVDVGGNYVTFHKLSVCLEIKKIINPSNESLGRLCSSAIGSSKFVYF